MPSIYRHLLTIIALLLSTAHLQAAGCGTNGNWSGLKCPARAGSDATIVSVNLQEGQFYCRYGGDDGETMPAPISLECMEEFNSKADDTDPSPGLKEKLSTFYNRVPSSSEEVYTAASFDKSLNTKKVNSDLKEVKAFNKSGKNAWENTLQTALNKYKIDSHTDYDRTLSSILAATFTIDPSYFKTGYLDNTTGEVMLLDDKKEIVNNNSIKSIGQAWYEWGSKNDVNHVTVTSPSPLDFMSKLVLGYLIKISEALRKVYNEAIMIFFLMGGIYSIGYYAFRKSLEKYGNEPFQMNKISFLSAAIISMVFFSAPTIKDGDVSSTAFIANSTETNAIENWSSLAQETVRYSIQSGTYFANLSSDLVMQAYLSLVGREAGFMNVNPGTIGEFESAIAGVNSKKKILGAQLNFYEDVCRKYFSKEGDDLFPATPMAIKNANNSNNDAKGVLSGKGITAKRLDYTACLKMEKSIDQYSANIQKEIIGMQSKATTMREVYNNDGDSAKGLDRLVGLMSYGQNAFGWVFVAAIPVSYFFFDNSEMFLYEHKVGNKTAGGKGSLIAALQNKGENHDTEQGFVSEISDASQDAILALGTSSMVTNSFWFLVPGFSDIFESIDKQFAKIMGMDEKGLPGDKKDGNALLSKFTASIGALASKIPYVSSLLEGLRKYVSGGSGAGGAISFAFTIAAFYIAVLVIVYAISATTIVAISAMLVLKITLFYIELMMFFMAIPIMGIYYTVLNKGGGKNYLAHFSQSVAMIFVTPLLIVFITAMLIPAAEFFSNFFDLMMKMLYVVMDEGGTALSDINQAATTTQVENAGIGEWLSNKWTALKGNGSIWTPTGVNTGAMQKVVTLISLNGMTKIFSYFATLIISLILIVNYKSWFSKMVGIDGGVDSMKEVSGEMKQGAGGKALNPLQ